MSDPRWAQIREVLDLVLEAPPEGRDALLRGICGNNRSLLAEIMELLAALDRVDSFLESPSHLMVAPDGSQSKATSEDGQEIPLRETRTVSIRSSEAQGEAIPERIGPYRILEKIGEGGFGVVYRAEQREAIRRVVALKVIKAGMDTKQVLARFDAEKNALSLMHHPNVARVLDSGQTDQGRPYFVMEYVDGASLTEYCKREKLRLEERLRLFQQVCRGVQHAHTKGVVHRDLKPANILVTLEDGQATPKIIDFGLAKALSQPLTAMTLITQRRHVIGTLDYMSPEQARSSGIDVDTKTDVYSLGVILYEMLVDVRPFEDLHLRDDAEILRILAEVDPPRPSHRLSRVDPETCSRLAESHGLDSSRLLSSLRGELDWIVMKALEKRRDRRYESPVEFANDLERYLIGHEPVEARPPSARYRIQKMARRNRRGITLMAVVMISLLAGLTWSVIERVRADTLARRISTVFGAWRVVDERERFEESMGSWARSAARLPELGDFVEVMRELDEMVLEVEAEVGHLRAAGFERQAEITSGLLEDFAMLKRRFERYYGRIGTLHQIWGTDEARERWQVATMTIEDADSCPQYSGMRSPPPQFGLIPLGLDPQSGLYEFWHVLSGAEPTRGEDGHIQMTPESGIVLVLLPGGEFRMGCDPPLGFHVRPGLVVTQVPEWSPAFGAGINPDDQLVGWRVDGEYGGLGDLVRKLAAEGGSVDFTFAGDETEWHATYDIPPPEADEPYELNAQYGEGPSNRVLLAPFFISKFEMTQAQWDRWAGANPSVRKAGVGKRSPRREYTWDQPVEGMSWNDARSTLFQMGLKLPTEAQWEYSCRSGTRTAYNTGGIGTLQGHANISDIAYASRKSGAAATAKWDDGYVYAAPVGSYPASSFGLHDMHGNVWEWCEDSAAWYSVPARAGDGLRVPLDFSFTEEMRTFEDYLADSETRIIRGGGFKNKQDHARSAYRWPYILAGDEDIGVRPCRPVEWE